MALMSNQKRPSMVLVLSCLVIAAPDALAQQQGVRATALAAASDSLDQQQLTSPRRRRRRSAGSSNVGYIDNAIIGNQLQIRYDFANGVNRADRVEFIYAKCGCYREVNVDPDAPGPAVPLAGRDPFTTPFIETVLDYHEVVLDVEYAPHERFSLFAELPYRFLKTQVIDEGSGIGDIRTGVKVGLVAEDAHAFTFQLGAYLPTGDALKGLGTDHLSLEPALLYYGGLTDRLKLEGELRYWIPIDPSTAAGTGPDFDPTDDFAGGVVRYGLGLGYDVSPDGPVRFTPIVELVGWSITSGIATGTTDGTLTTATFEDAGGITIVNVKVGARFGVRDDDAIFIGYGESLTKWWWYERVVRAEYRFVF
jgi:hypothetical protein